jgi:hypothetical protein
MLEMLNQDVCYFYGEAQAVYKEFGGIVFNEEESLINCGSFSGNERASPNM